jgi:hypothetical protein
MDLKTTSQSAIEAAFALRSLHCRAETRDCRPLPGDRIPACSRPSASLGLV